MKIRLIFALFMVMIIFTSSINALSIQIDKNEFAKSETFFAKIQGNILDSIKKENIFFYKDHTKIPLTYDIIKIDDTYYIYSILPANSGNYSIQIKDVYYYESSQYVKSNLIQYFTITNQTAQFNVNPAVIRTNKDFVLKITNLMPSSTQVDYSFNDINQTPSYVILGPNNYKNINIPISEFNSTLSTFLSLSSPMQSYLLPVLIIKNSSENNQVFENESVKDNFFVSYKKIDVRLKPNESYFDSIEIQNIGNSQIKDISLKVSKEIDPFIYIPRNHINSLAPKESAEFNFTAIFSKSGNYSGYIIISSSNYSEIIDVNFIVNLNVVSNSSLSSKKNCTDLGGTKCTASQYCSGGSNVNSIQGFCCLGTCKEFDSSDEKKGKNWYAIIFIILIIGIIAAFLFIKFKKPKSFPDQELKSKEKSFSDRFQTKDKLSKI